MRCFGLVEALLIVMTVAGAYTYIYIYVYIYIRVHIIYIYIHFSENDKLVGRMECLKMLNY